MLLYKCISSLEAKVRVKQDQNCRWFLLISLPVHVDFGVHPSFNHQMQCHHLSLPRLGEVWHVIAEMPKSLPLLVQLLLPQFFV